MDRKGSTVWMAFPARLSASTCLSTREQPLDWMPVASLSGTADNGLRTQS